MTDPVIRIKPDDVMLEQWVIYDSPIDYPGKFVARKFLITRSGFFPTETTFIEDNLDAVRSQVCNNDPNLVMLPRFAGDDRKIVETWI